MIIFISFNWIIVRYFYSLLLFLKQHNAMLYLNSIFLHIELNPKIDLSEATDCARRTLLIFVHFRILKLTICRIFKFWLHSIEILKVNCDRHKLRVTGLKCWLPDTMCSTGQIFISGAALKCEDSLTATEIHHKR